MPVPGPLRADQALALAQAAGRHQDERERDVGGRIGEDAGRVREAHAARRAGRDVDVVVADRDVRDDAQLRPGGVEEGVVDAIVEEGDDGVGAVDRRVQLVGRERPVLRVEPEVARRAQQVERRPGDRPRDDDPREVGGGAGRGGAGVTPAPSSAPLIARRAGRP